MALCTVQWFSAALGLRSEARVIVPEAATGPFPVLYLLHGLSGNYTDWTQHSQIEQYAREYPWIVVMPDGGSSYYTDSVSHGAYATAIIEELLPFIDNTFRTAACRERRAIGGLSMGGYGALKLALTHPALFCSVTSHSCSRALSWTHDPSPPESRFIEVFGAQPRGSRHDLFAITETLDPHALPALRLDCGLEDPLLQGNRRFHQHLQALGIPHQYQEYPGGHTWEYWDRRVREALQFHAQSFQAPL